MPSKLIEPELFGHEKEAFNGTLERQIGKFERAGKGTVFFLINWRDAPKLHVKYRCVLPVDSPGLRISGKFSAL